MGMPPGMLNLMGGTPLPAAAFIQLPKAPAMQQARTGTAPPAETRHPPVIEEAGLPGPHVREL
eukprot:6123179-Amphidinium_carterae.1